MKNEPDPIEITEAEFARDPGRFLDAAVVGAPPFVIVRQGGKPNVVLLSETDFGGWHETVYLLSSPVNAARLLESIREADAGNTVEHELVYPESRVAE